MRRLAAVLAFLVTAATPAAAAARPSVRTVPFAVRVIPTFAGVPITIDGRTAWTDANGIAHFAALPAGSDFVNRVHAADTEFTLHGRRVRIEQARVYDRGATVSLYVYYQTRFTFSNATHGPFDRTLIRTVTVKSTTGAIETLDANKPAWLFGTRVVPLAGSLEAKDVLWSAQDVPYKGSNLVNSSQQRFAPAHSATVNFSLLFFHARLHIYDAFFGFGQGRSIELTFPNGSTQRFAIAANGSVDIPSLPRGTYRLTVLGAGPKMTRPIALSRDQTLSLKFYSWLDLGLVLLVGFGLVVGLLATGWYRRKRHRRRVRRGETPPEGAEEKTVEAVDVGGGTP